MNRLFIIAAILGVFGGMLYTITHQAAENARQDEQIQNYKAATERLAKAMYAVNQAYIENRKKSPEAQAYEKHQGKIGKLLDEKPEMAIRSLNAGAERVRLGLQDITAGFFTDRPAKTGADESAAAGPGTR